MFDFLAESGASVASLCEDVFTAARSGEIPCCLLVVHDVTELHSCAETQWNRFVIVCFSFLDRSPPSKTSHIKCDKQAGDFCRSEHYIFNVFLLEAGSWAIPQYDQTLATDT